MLKHFTQKNYIISKFTFMFAMSKYEQPYGTSQLQNKSSAVADIAAQCCRIQIVMA